MLNPNYNSHYKPYANESLYWLPSDTKELYEKNLKEKYQLLKDNDWIDKSFTYNFNSHGFRCNEFTTEPTVMFLGCSLTCGIGLPIESIWPELVSKQLNMHCANLGQGGGSNDSSFRLCYGWIDIIKPKIVVLMSPPGIRLEIISDNFMFNLSGAWDQDNTKLYNYFVRDWSMNDNNNYFNSLKNQLAIENLCTSRNIKFLCLSDQDLADIKESDLARDLIHSGRLKNKKISEYVLTKI